MGKEWLVEMWKGSGALKPCPFCGNPDVEIVVHKKKKKKLFRDRYAVLCRYDPGCGSESGVWYSPEEAADMWNQREGKWRE